jgi:hypothetical protein
VKRSVALSVLVAACVLAAGCSRSSSSKPPASTSAPTTAAAAGATTSSTAPNPCANVTLQATDVGITPTDITVEVMADVGSPLAPGLFQGNLDAINAFATYVNANGGVGCRQLKVRTWDSKLDPTESKNGLIDSCTNAFAMVGSNALFNPDVSAMTNCVDKTGAATGLPDINALANDVNELCAPTAFTVQAVFQPCPPQTGVATYGAFTGAAKWIVQKFGPGLHGIFIVPGDLPTTRRSATYSIDALAQQGITWDDTPLASGADPQPAYTPRVQIAKAKGSTIVYDGSNDVAMINMRKESAAQGLNTVKTWVCSLACYTKLFLTQGGAAVEGTYLWMQYLPVEEASLNPAEQAYVTAIGDKQVSWAAQAWQAALAFKQAVDQIVAKGGPNAITRAALLSTLKTFTNFDADGWMGPKPLQGNQAASDCFVMMQVQNGKFVRVYPTKPGTMDCNPSYLATVNVDPVAEAAKLK